MEALLIGQKVWLSLVDFAKSFRQKHLIWASPGMAFVLLPAKKVRAWLLIIPAKTIEHVTELVDLPSGSLKTLDGETLKKLGGLSRVDNIERQHKVGLEVYCVETESFLGLSVALHSPDITASL